MQYKQIRFLLFSFALLLSSCNSSTANQKGKVEKTPYEKMEVVFIGKHTKYEIKSLLEKVMEFHGEEINESNQLKSADALVALRKSSKNGITEMDILNHMNKNGANKLSFPYQAAISFTLLETKE